MDGGTIPPQDDAPVTAAGDEVEIRLPEDPRIPQPDDADSMVSKELGGAAPAIGPGRSRQEFRDRGADGSGGDGERRTGSRLVLPRQSLASSNRKDSPALSCPPVPAHAGRGADAGRASGWCC